jgi:SAM-dependent methyltransferase
MPAVTQHHPRDLAASNLFYRQPELYDQVQADPEHTVARRVERAVDTHAPAARTLLDLGCGTGRDLEALAQRFACVGVDLQPDLVAYAHRVRPSLDIRVGNMCDLRLGTAVDVLTCLGNSLAYLHDDADLAAVFATFAAHATLGSLLIIATLTEPVLADARTHRVDTADLHADVTISYSWDPLTGISTMLRHWCMDDRTIHEDHITRRVRSASELDDHAAAAGFELADDCNAAQRVYRAGRGD